MATRNKKNYSQITSSVLLVKLKKASEVLQKITSEMEGYQSYCEYNGEPIQDICKHYGDAKEVLEELKAVDKIIDRNKHYFELLTALFSDAYVSLDGYDVEGGLVLEACGYKFKENKKVFSADYEFDSKDSELLWYIAYGKWQSYEKWED